MEEQVLDACCGSRMFWFDRRDARAVLMDNRRESHVLIDKSSSGGSRLLTVSPDVVGDFTHMDFPDNSFSLVVFDPPHLLRAGAKGWQAKKYGKLPEEWREFLSLGFAECFRVLRPNGTLIFKWNEHEIPVSQILALTPEKPLFGQRCGKNGKDPLGCIYEGRQALSSGKIDPRDKRYARERLEEAAMVAFEMGWTPGEIDNLVAAAVQDAKSEADG